MSIFLKQTMAELETSLDELSFESMDQINLSISEDTLESMSLEHAIERDTLMHDECLQAAATLENIYNSLKSVHDEGSRLDKLSFEGYFHAVSSVLGDEQASKVFQGQSLESLESDMSFEVTEVTLEGLSKIIKNLYSAAKNAKARISKGAMDAITRVFGGIKKLDAKAKKLSSELGIIDRNIEPKNDKITISGGSRLHVGGKIDAKTVISGLDDTTSVITKLHETYGNASKDIVGWVDKLLAETKKLFDREEDPDKREILEFRRNLMSQLVKGIAKSQQSLSNFHNRKISGGKIIQSPTGVTVDSLLKMTTVETTLPYIKDDNLFGDYDDKQEIEAPKLDEIKKVVEVAQKLISQTIDIEKKFHSYVSDIGKASGQMYEAYRLQGAGKLNAKISSAMNADFLTLYIEHMEASATKRTMGYQFSVARAALVYAETALKNLK